MESHLQKIRMVADQLCAADLKIPEKLVIVAVLISLHGIAEYEVVVKVL